MANTLKTLTELQGDFIARKLMLMEARLKAVEDTIVILDECRKKMCGEDKPEEPQEPNAEYSRYIDAIVDNSLQCDGEYSRFLPAIVDSSLQCDGEYSRYIEASEEGGGDNAEFLRSITSGISAEFLRTIEQQ